MINAEFWEYFDKKYAHEYNVPLENIFSYLYDNDFEYINTATRGVYPFSNERLMASLEDIDLVGKRVLTVGSSGDQVLTSIYKGATDIALIDGNPNAQFFTELKLAGIKNFDFEEFKKFMTAENIFNRKYYAKISHDLSEETKLFFDTIFLYADYDDIDNIKNAFVRPFYSIGSAFNRCSDKHCYYQDKKEYEKLKNNIHNAKITFECAPFEKFNEVAQGEFDLIMLSNIYDYVEMPEFYEGVYNIAKSHLKAGGSMQIAYAFSPMDFVYFSRDFGNYLSSIKLKNYPNYRKFKKISKDFNMETKTTEDEYENPEFSVFLHKTEGM